MNGYLRQSQNSKILQWLFCKKIIGSLKQIRKNEQLLPKMKKCAGNFPKLFSDWPKSKHMNKFLKQFLSGALFKFSRCRNIDLMSVGAIKRNLLRNHRFFLTGDKIC